MTSDGPGPDEAPDLLIGRPATLASEQKAVLGVFRGNTLIAVIDLPRGWPDPVTAHIGLLQVHPDQRRARGPVIGKAMGYRTVGPPSHASRDRSARPFRLWTRPLTRG